ncbi:uncharacterized protein PAC_17524 [Phialocephala subalpina]|uniref:Uncharacterized protein n=1 Tax=Phialocephala subalpina TaxID=576137 RepID=A0A1L7XRI9_9HELO|nr:uncharacterized protein PAC_17524 [Phialocephala subalpina]
MSRGDPDTERCAEETKQWPIMDATRSKPFPSAPKPLLESLGPDLPQKEGLFAKQPRRDPKPSKSADSRGLSSIFITWLFKPSRREKFQRQQSGRSLVLISNDIFATSYCEEKPPEILVVATQWYLDYLTQKLVDSWSLISEVVSGLTAGVGPQIGDEQYISSIFKVVIKQFRHENLALADITDALYNERLLKETTGERTHANQLVFAIVGWLSFLYRPQIQIQEETFNLYTSHTFVTASHRRRARPCRLASDTIISQSFDWVDQPLAALLGSFGITPTGRSKAEVIEASRRARKCLKYNHSIIDPHLVCYSTLDTVASIKIELVDTIDLHLAFDSSTRVLSIFRFPSYCLVMYHTKALAFQDRFQRDFHTLGEDDEESQGEFFREVLLTYRLLFGQAKSSWKAAMKSELHSWALEQSDPLLEILCWSSHEDEQASQVYESIDAEDISGRYYSGIKFPRLGTRLMELQSYVRHHSPSTFQELWNDRRQPAHAWWTFWVIILIGGLTIVFSLIIGIIQTISEFHMKFSAFSISRPNLKRFVPAFDNNYKFLANRGISIMFIVAVALDLLCLTLVAMIAWPEFISKVAQSNRLAEREGNTKITWICHCGKRLEDEYSELVHGAAASLEVELQKEKEASSCKDELCEDHDIESQLDSNERIPRRRRWRGHELFSGCNFFWAKRRNTSQSCRLDSNGLPGEAPDYLPPQPAEPLFLLVCIEKLNGSVGLTQIDVSGMTSDRVLFSCLRHYRLSIRGKWLPLLKFRCLESIAFVQFELWASDEVDVQPHEDWRMLPPESRAEEYAFDTTETLPPIGPGRLMHLWNSPKHPDGTGRTCLSRFPKRRKERLYVSSGGMPAKGWGICLVEGIDWVWIWLLVFVIVLIGSFVFAIAFSVLDHDIQSAFSIASYAVSSTTLGIGACSICSQKFMNRKSG